MVEAAKPVILIPAYQPGKRLMALLTELVPHFRRIVLVDDGSEGCEAIFTAAGPLVEKVISHERNLGKGAALKTGLAYVGDHDVITVDADGQHRLADILAVAKALGTHRDGLVLGSRSFRGAPFRSVWGNLWTRWIFFLVTRLYLRDTQTGLRGIPASLVGRLAELPGTRYEYEMVMLADACRHPQRPLELPVATVYIDDNRDSHFRPLRDTFRIFRALFAYCRQSDAHIAV